MVQVSEFMAKAISDLDFSTVTSQEQRGLVVLTDTITARLKEVNDELSGAVRAHRPAAPELTERVSTPSRRTA